MNYLICIRSILMITLEIREKKRRKNYSTVQKITHISAAIDLKLFILVRKQSFDNAVLKVTKCATRGQLKAKI